MQTLNNNSSFKIKVPVIMLHEAYLTFCFQEGYGRQNIIDSLTEENVYFEEYEHYIYINKIIDNKSEFFLVELNDLSGPYPYRFGTPSVSGRYEYLLPFFMLKNKDDFLDMRNYMTYPITSETSNQYEINVSYEHAKFVYSQTDQKALTFNDDKKQLIFNNMFYFNVGDTYLTIDYNPA